MQSLTEGFLCVDFNSFSHRKITNIAFLGGLGKVLAASRAVLERSWKLLGPSWATLERSWRLLGPSWAALGRLGGTPGPSGLRRRSRTRPPRGVLGVSWPVLKASWASPGILPGPSCERLGLFWIIFWASWDILEASCSRVSKKYVVF